MGIYKLLGLSLPLNDNLQYRFYIKVICHSVRPLTSLNNQPFTMLHTPFYLESFRLQNFIVSFFLGIVNAGEPAAEKQKLRLGVWMFSYSSALIATL